MTHVESGRRRHADNGVRATKLRKPDATLINAVAQIIVDEVEDEPMWSAVVIAKKIIGVFEQNREEEK